MKTKIYAILWVVAIFFLLSIPFTIALGKYQVCKNYFSELNAYVCMFTNLPPYTGNKK